MKIEVKVEEKEEVEKDIRSLLLPKNGVYLYRRRNGSKGRAFFNPLNPDRVF